MGTRAFTLIEVVITIAIISLVGVILASIFSLSGGSMNLVASERNIDGATNSIFGILADRQLCDTAMRYNGSPVVWNFKTQAQASVNQIWSHGKIVFSAPDVFSPTLTLNQMFLREPTGANGEPPKAESTVTIGPNTYDAIAAVLVLRYSGTGKGQLGGAVFHDRTIGLMIYLNQASHQIEGCYPSGTNEMIVGTCQTGSKDCNGNVISCGSQPYSVCKALYYVQGFCANGAPQCACRYVCPPAVTIYK